MQIVIHPVDVNMTAGLKEYVQERLNKTFKNYSFITNIEVYLKKTSEANEEKAFVVEGIIRLPGPEIFAESTAKSHDAALNETIDKLRRQLQKYKDKFHAHRS